jgi:NAD(P)-dependent dehydrogenase (short-subunit alcohol dehydrogenase family)
MELSLIGKRVLITGSSRGIGLAIAKAFIAEGSAVVINARSEQSLECALAELPGCFGVSADVTKVEEAERLVHEARKLLNGLDVLICNAGSGSSVPPGTETYDEWQRVLALNFFSATNMVESSRTALAESNGAIVCISSICGVEIIPGAPVTYSVAKAALNTYVKGISRPLAKDGVRINAIAPGNILFEGSSWERKEKENTEAVRKMLATDVPLGRFGSAEEIAELVIWLASDKSAFTTGVVWELDGGQTRS